MTAQHFTPLPARIHPLWVWCVTVCLALGLAVSAPPLLAYADNTPAVSVTWDSDCTGFTAMASGYADSDAVTVRWHRDNGKIMGTQLMKGNGAVTQHELPPGHAALVSFEAQAATGSTVTPFTVAEATCPTPTVSAQWVRNCSGITLTLQHWPAGYRTNIVWYNAKGLEMGRTTGGKVWGKYNFAPKTVSRVDYFVYGPAGGQVTDTRSAFTPCDPPWGNPWSHPARAQEHFR